MATISISITRQDPWVESYDLYAKSNTEPLEDGDGIFIMNLPINPIDTSVSTTWTTLDDSAWYIRAIPITRKEAGPGANL